MKTLARFLVAASLLTAANVAPAITITATQDDTALVDALLAGVGSGIAVTGRSFSGHQQTGFLTNSPETSSGTFTNTSGTYGIGPGIVFTTGAVEERTYFDFELNVTETFSGYGDGPNRVQDNSTAYLDPNTFDEKPATAEQETLLQPISPFPHFDVTELIINFDVQPGYDRVSFNVAYGTDEYIEFKNSDFIDIFAVFLNGTNIALVNGNRFNVDHPDFAAVTGTELDGLLAPGGNPLLSLGGGVNPGPNELRFIIADTGDDILDSTVYLSGLTGVAVVPLPAGVWLLGTAVAGLAGRRLLKKREPVAAGAT
jgi:hypothetical protein